MKDRLMGPPSDFGWSRCHGCNATEDDRGSIRHRPECPGVCVRADCDWHES